MLAYLARRIAFLPIALALANLFGFAYALFARWVQATRNPYLAVATPPEPFWPAYQTYLQAGLGGGFGEMPTARGKTILDSVLTASANSLGLLAIAFTISLMIGLLLGFSAARNQPASVKGWLAPLATVGLALPPFYFGAQLIAFSVYYSFMVSANGKLLVPLSGFGWDNHLIFPVIALTIRPTFQVAQAAAVLLTGELGKQYVTAARAFGHSWTSLRLSHALRNMIAPLILNIASGFRLLVAELILVETLFNWPGVGRMLANTLKPPAIVGVNQSLLASPTYLNPPIVASVLTVLALLFIIADIAASFSARALDPRLAAQGLETRRGR